MNGSGRRGLCVRLLYLAFHRSDRYIMVVCTVSYMAYGLGESVGNLLRKSKLQIILCHKSNLRSSLLLLCLSRPRERHVDVATCRMASVLGSPQQVSTLGFSGQELTIQSPTNTVDWKLQ